MSRLFKLVCKQCKPAFVLAVGGPGLIAKGSSHRPGGKAGPLHTRIVREHANPGARVSSRPISEE